MEKKKSEPLQSQARPVGGCMRKAIIKSQKIPKFCPLTDNSISGNVDRSGVLLQCALGINVQINNRKSRRIGGFDE
jgi:hypothetical protein